MTNPFMLRDPIVTQCAGCNNTRIGPQPGIAECSVYLIPASKWRVGKCPRATHLQGQGLGVEKKFEDPLKKSKKAFKHKK